MNDVTFKILNNTRQQWLDFKTAQMGLQKHLGMNDTAWNNAMMEVGEYFVNMVWQRSDEAYRKSILTGETFGFWKKFKYEWGKNDYDLWLHFCRKEIVIRDKDTFIRYKKDFLTLNTAVREDIVYRVTSYYK
ncbi:MAG: hypothetical protein ACRCR9_00090 [Chitinophagaceae bacterium]